MQEIAPPQVPYQGTILAPATSVPTVAAASQPNLPPLPELVGLVKSPNGASAILQVGRIPTSVSVGEMLGSSGWRLYFSQQRRSGAGAAGEHQRLLG